MKVASVALLIAVGLFGFFYSWKGDPLEPFDLVKVNTSQCGLNYKFLDNTEFYHFSYMSDGLKVKGVLGRPKKLKSGKYPVIIYNRGYQPGLSLFDCRIAKLFPYIVHKGYVLIAPQYRGWAGGEGRDEFGGKDLNDVYNIIEASKSLPYVDKSNYFMFGGSRGGMTTYMSLRKKFPVNAASVFGGVTDQYRELLINRSDGMETEFYKMIPNFNKNKDFELRKRSAIFWANEIDTPLLILHGRKDYEVKIENALELADLLKKYKKEHKLIIFDEGDHCCLSSQIDNNKNDIFHNHYWHLIIDATTSYFKNYMK